MFIARSTFIFPVVFYGRYVDYFPVPTKNMREACYGIVADGW